MKHKLIIGAGVAGLGLGTAYYLRMTRLSKEMEIVTKVNIFKLDLSGLQLRVDVLLKNPSGGSISIKYPFVKMQYKDSTFATSEVKNQNFQLAPYSEKQLYPIFVTIGLISLATSAPDLIAEYKSNGKITIAVSTVTTLNGFMPYTKTNELKIG